MAHPLPWNFPLSPDTLIAGSVEVVAGGARAAGTAADALVTWDHTEQARRHQAGLGAVTSLWLLDSVMNLPLGSPTRASDLSETTWDDLRRAPAGVVEIEDAWVTRLLTPPLTVVAAAVGGNGWRRPLQRVGRFAPFAQRLLILDTVPPPRLIWEAEVAGVGVWVIENSYLIEACTPEPFNRRYWKPAGWRFAEHAYAAWLSARHLSESSPASAGHQARTAFARSDQHQPELQLMLAGYVALALLPALG
jgi:hypothetical protein